MRTADSLAMGVSQYMAELKRIEFVVRAAREARRTGKDDELGEAGPAGGSRQGGSDLHEKALPVLYLLDEPLQGTNEAERRVAVQTILGHLLEADAVGAVATHDLYLDEVESLRRAARPFHLEGDVEEGEEGPLLRFDYKLREGRATSTNALALLRAVGLGPRKGSEE
jgi:DNA mismatch repair ATPase MutS